MTGQQPRPLILDPPLNELVLGIAGEVSQACALHQAAQDKLRNLRNRLWATLDAHGVARRIMAEMGSVTQPAVDSVLKREPEPFFRPGQKGREDHLNERLAALGIDYDSFVRDVANRLASQADADAAGGAR